MLVYPMTMLLSYPIMCRTGTVPTIISEEIAPEITPKVSMVFFIAVSATSSASRRRRCRWNDDD